MSWLDGFVFAGAFAAPPAAAMAGIGYAITPSPMLDVGSRHMDFDDVETASDVVGQMSFTNVAAHEARLGVRWSFYNAAATN